MSQFPHLPLLTDAFIADTGHLSAAETGALILTTIAAHNAQPRGLPDDDHLMARVARCDARTWRRMRPAVLAFFRLHGDRWVPSARWLRIVREAISAPVRREVLSAQSCVYCGTTSGPFEVDHVVPLARGGWNGVENYACACKPCNRSKRAKMVAEWLP